MHLVNAYSSYVDLQIKIFGEIPFHFLATWLITFSSVSLWSKVEITVVSMLFYPFFTDILKFAKVMQDNMHRSHMAVHQCLYPERAPNVAFLAFRMSTQPHSGTAQKPKYCSCGVWPLSLGRAFISGYTESPKWNTGTESSSSKMCRSMTEWSLLLTSGTDGSWQKCGHHGHTMTTHHPWSNSHNKPECLEKPSLFFFWISMWVLSTAPKHWGTFSVCHHDLAFSQ